LKGEHQGIILILQNFKNMCDMHNAGDLTDIDRWERCSEFLKVFGDTSSQDEKETILFNVMERAGIQKEVVR